MKMADYNSLEECGCYFCVKGRTDPEELKRLLRGQGGPARAPKLMPKMGRPSLYMVENAVLPEAGELVRFLQDICCERYGKIEFAEGSLMCGGAPVRFTLLGKKAEITVTALEDVSGKVAVRGHGVLRGEIEARLEGWHK